jgi:hypothetical protein
MSSLSVASLRRQLEVEMSSQVQDSSSETTVPAMECLRSPTTRTFLAIMQNRNHYDVIRDFVLDAEEEERQTQELVDAAEQLQAVPISEVFAKVLKESVKDDTIRFFLPRNAAGDIFGIKPEESPILKKWGKRQPPVEGDDDPSALDVPIEQLFPVSSSDPISTSVKPLTTKNSDESSVREMDCGTLDAQVRANESESAADSASNGRSSPGTAPSPAKSSPSQQTPPPTQKLSLRQMIQQQQSEHKVREEKFKEYRHMVDELGRWQDTRIRVLGELLEPADTSFRSENSASSS